MKRNTDPAAVHAETDSSYGSDKSGKEIKSGDMSKFYTSSLLEDSILYDCEFSNGRNIERQSVLKYLDRLIEEKVDAQHSDFTSKIDSELERIVNEKQQLREALKKRNTYQNSRKYKKKKLGKNKEQTKEAIALTEAKEKTKAEAADHRLDTFIDRIINYFMKKIKASGNKAGIFFVYIQRRTLQAECAVKEKFYPQYSKLEQRLVIKAAAMVDWIDRKIEKHCENTSRLTKFCYAKWFGFRAWAEKHKKVLLGSFITCSAAAAAVALIIGNMTAYEYLYNGKVLGIVKDQQDVYKTIDIMGDKLALAYGTTIEIDKTSNISFRKVIGTDLKIDDKDDVLNAFTYLRDMNAKAYAITVDGRHVAVMSSRAVAQRMLDTIKNTYIVDNDSVDYSYIGFAQDVKIKEVNTKIRNIDEEEETLEYLMTGAVEKRVHQVQSGDTFNQIAKDYGLKPSELLASNPGVIPEKLHIGQELVLTQVCPVMTVQTKEVVTYNASIDYDINYEETSTLFQGEQTVKSRGIPGERIVVAEVIRNNGVEVFRNELESTVVKQPVAQVVLKGTKELPPLVGTGTFHYPTRGRLTSRFGTRWGRMHYGIDLAAPTGTKIRASDGGKVIYSGRDGALGLTVRIDHGGNRVTVYGHCSKLYVSVGDKVYQGQHIANVGNTGNSTGPHVHFEVRINGVAQNPLKYLQ